MGRNIYIAINSISEFLICFNDYIGCVFFKDEKFNWEHMWCAITQKMNQFLDSLLSDAVIFVPSDAPGHAVSIDNFKVAVKGLAAMGSADVQPEEKQGKTIYRYTQSYL